MRLDSQHEFIRVADRLARDIERIAIARLLDHYAGEYERILSDVREDLQAHIASTDR